MIMMKIIIIIIIMINGNQEKSCSWAEFQVRKGRQATVTCPLSPPPHQFEEGYSQAGRGRKDKDRVKLGKHRERERGGDEGGKGEVRG